MAIVPELEQALHAAADFREVTADLGGCEFIDCAVFSLFLRVRREMLEEGRSLLLVDPKGQVRRLLSVCEAPDGFVVGAGKIAPY